MLDPVLFVPVALTVYSLREKKFLVRTFLAVVAGIVVSFVTALITYESRIATGLSGFGPLPFYVVGSCLWAALFAAISQIWAKNELV